MSDNNSARGSTRRDSADESTVTGAKAPVHRVLVPAPQGPPAPAPNALAFAPDASAAPTVLPRTTTDIFGPNAVSRNLPFHPRARITAVEYAALLPEHLRSYDLIDRLITNGGSTQLLAKIINFHRTLPRGPLRNNSICKTVQNSMRKKHANWTVSEHANYISGNTWRANDLTMRGKKAQGQEGWMRQRKSVMAGEDMDVRLDALAIDVRFFPDSRTGDGFELVRAVQFAYANPHLDLMFLRDFDWVNKFLGRLRLQPRHHDEQCFGRWQGESKNSKPEAWQMAAQQAEIAKMRCTPAQEDVVRAYLAHRNNDDKKTSEHEEVSEVEEVTKVEEVSEDEEMSDSTEMAEDVQMSEDAGTSQDDFPSGMMDDNTEYEISEAEVTPTPTTRVGPARAVSELGSEATEAAEILQEIKNGLKANRTPKVRVEASRSDRFTQTDLTGEVVPKEAGAPAWLEKAVAKNNELIEMIRHEIEDKNWLYTGEYR